MGTMKKIFTITFLFTIFSCAPKIRFPLSQGRNYLGTVAFIRVYSLEEENTFLDGGFDRVFGVVEEADSRLSMYNPESEVSRLNAQGKASLGEDTAYVLTEALKIATLSEGRFDPTIAPLVKLWGIGSEAPAVPERSTIEALLPLVGYDQIDFQPPKVRFLKEGMALDFGGIAKGHAADLAKKALLEEGVSGAIIDFGGNILLIGEKEDGSPWRVGIQDPRQGRGQYLGILEARDVAVVTSGTYERYFEQDGRVYHHILSPQDGYPLENGLLSVTVVAEKSLEADGLSTALFTMGSQEALSYANGREDIAVILVDKRNQVYLSEGLEEDFTLVSSDFSLVL